MALIAMTEFSYIKWFDAFRFELKVPLGSKGIYYIFEAEYNMRSQRWYITISTEDGVVLIQNKKLVPNTDLLERCFNQFKPDCALMPILTNENVTELNYDTMISGIAKLFIINLTSTEVN